MPLVVVQVELAVVDVHVNHLVDEYSRHLQGEHCRWIVWTEVIIVGWETLLPIPERFSLGTAAFQETT
ncbi:hypothetical protein D3C87_2071750 [compost metagenome]